MYLLFSCFLFCALYCAQLQSVCVSYPVTKVCDAGGLSGEGRMNFGHPNPNRNSLHVCSPSNYLSLFSGLVFQCVSSSKQHGSAPNNNSDNSINIIKRI